MAYVIEKGIPAPAPKTGRKSRYPFKYMGIGDSFNAGKISAKARLTLASAASHHAKRYNRVLVTRKDADGNVRCWRVA